MSSHLHSGVLRLTSSDSLPQFYAFFLTRHLECFFQHSIIMVLIVSALLLLGTTMFSPLSHSASSSSDDKLAWGPATLHAHASYSGANGSNKSHAKLTFSLVAEGQTYKPVRISRAIQALQANREI
ncbi:hypothetical protein XENOCAPTIV_004292 [Xenoophorus captivus]|uniref:Uncharacterized protein n=1 Tax=Xenoophorus captivus TaxID=1517983 RepID=A0ABV0RNM4_9TELE